jgi:hypothetical protein
VIATYPEQTGKLLPGETMRVDNYAEFLQVLCAAGAKHHQAASLCVECRRQPSSSGSRGVVSACSRLPDAMQTILAEGALPVF